MGIGQKIKDVASDVKHAVTPGSHKHTHETGTTGLGATSYKTAPTGYATTGTYGTTAATDATYDITGQLPRGTGTEHVTQEEAAAEAAGTGRPAVAETVTTAVAEPAGGAVRAGEGAVCGVEHFTVTEDRPVVMERVQYVKEHHPVEKEFVVEMRATGAERAREGPVEHLGTEEHIVSKATPKGPCA